VPPVGTQRSSLHAVDGTAGDTELSLGLHLGASGVVRGGEVRGIVHLGAVSALGTAVLVELSTAGDGVVLGAGHEDGGATDLRAEEAGEAGEDVMQICSLA